MGSLRVQVLGLDIIWLCGPALEGHVIASLIASAATSRALLRKCLFYIYGFALGVVQLVDFRALAIYTPLKI